MTDELTLVAAREMARKAMLAVEAAPSASESLKSLLKDQELSVAMLAEAWMVEATGVLDRLEAASSLVPHSVEADRLRVDPALRAAWQAQEAAIDEVEATVLRVHRLPENGSADPELAAAMQAQLAARGKWDFSSVDVVQGWPQRRNMRKVAALAAAADPEWAAAAEALGISTAPRT